MMAHRPLTCNVSGESCDHIGPMLEEEVFPLMYEYKADMYWCGHVHAYERVSPINNETRELCSDCVRDGGKLYYKPPYPVQIMNGIAGRAVADNNYFTPGVTYPDFVAQHYSSINYPYGRSSNRRRRRAERVAYRERSRPGKASRINRDRRVGPLSHTLPRHPPPPTQSAERAAACRHAGAAVAAGQRWSDGGGELGARICYLLRAAHPVQQGGVLRKAVRLPVVRSRLAERRDRRVGVAVVAHRLDRYQTALGRRTVALHDRSQFLLRHVPVHQLARAAIPDAAGAGGVQVAGAGGHHHIRVGLAPRPHSAWRMVGAVAVRFGQRGRGAGPRRPVALGARLPVGAGQSVRQRDVSGHVAHARSSALLLSGQDFCQRGLVAVLDDPAERHQRRTRRHGAIARRTPVAGRRVRPQRHRAWRCGCPATTVGVVSAAPRVARLPAGICAQRSAGHAHQRGVVLVRERDLRQHLQRGGHAQQSARGGAGLFHLPRADHRVHLGRCGRQHLGRLSVHREQTTD
eukprot:ctg_248.g136